MKYYVLCVICAINVLSHFRLLAQVNAEDVLINRILIQLQRKDDSAYASLFPKYEDLYKQVINYSATTTEDSLRILNLRTKPEILQIFDPAYNPEILRDFEVTIAKGKDSGLHWNDILLARYELQKMHLANELVGLEKIVNIRLAGFVYVRDMLTRRTYMIGITDVMHIEDKWYGGRVVNIQEASSEEEYHKKLDGERKFIKEVIAGGPEYLDSLRRESQKKKEAASASREEEEKKDVHTKVVARKYYVGEYDGRIPVELYIRYMEGGCPEGICAWEAMYRIGDMEYFTLLKVSKSPEGVWSFIEEDVGVMELKLSGTKYRGTWISYTDQTEYSIRLSEKESLGKHKLKKLDKEIEELLMQPY